MIFRSLLFLLALLVIATPSAHAQRLFDLGVKAGVSSDDLQLSGEASTRHVLGFHGGLFARVKPPLFPGVQVEALYSTVGSDAQGPAGENVHIRTNYLQLPAFLIFSLGPLELHAGGYYGHPLSSSVKGVLEEGVEIDLDDPDADYGLLGGAGVRISRFYGGIRYNLGLNDLQGNSPFAQEMRNRQAQAYIGFGLFK
jgi:hypothetical protein